MMRFPPLPTQASDAATPLRSRRVSGYFSSTAIATLVMLGAANIAGAQDWTGAVDSDYGTAGNWDPAAVPAAGDDVTVDAGNDVDVDGAAFAANSLLQSSGLMTVTSTGALSLAGNAEFRQQGALQIDGITVDYYSATKGSFGLQIGALQYAHVLFFMTDPALMRFRRSEGWAVGGDVKYAFNDRGENLRAETTTITAPVVAVIFGQAGLQIGATLDGVKYTRIIP